jgi:hypothetical protein
MDEVLYRSAHEAIAVSLRAAIRNGYVVPSMAGLLSGSRDTSGRLNTMEMHGQAGLVLAQIERLPAGPQAAAWLTYGKDILPRMAHLEMASALVPTITTACKGESFSQRMIAMLVLRACGYRGYGVRRVAQSCSAGWKDVDNLRHRVDKAMSSVRERMQEDVESLFRERGWI